MRAVVCVLVLAVMPCLGCYSTWDLTPKDLHTLKGFEANDATPIRDADGTVFMFDKGTDLTFERNLGREGSREASSSFGKESHRFSLIDLVDSNALSGVDDQSREVTVDLTRVESVQAKKFSVKKTVLAATVTTILVGGTIAAVIGLSKVQFGGYY